MTKTVAKYTESHDRLTVTCKFANGEKLRVNASRYRDSMSGTIDMRSPETAKFFKWTTTEQQGENPGIRMKRVAEHIGKFNSFAEAVKAI